MPSPVRPPEGIATTPPTRPWSTSEKLRTGAFSMSPKEIVEIVFPSFRFSTATPVPVATISSSAMAVTGSTKSTSSKSPARTVTVCEPVRYPIRCARTVTSPGGTVSSYRPSGVVIAPKGVPGTKT